MNVNVKSLFSLHGKLEKHLRIAMEIAGGVFWLALWQLASSHHWVRTSILPSPWSIIASFPELWYKNDLLGNALYSITLNLLGYLETAAIALPIGFLIGLQPWFRAITERYITALRYLPLSALLGLFMLAFGIETRMKVQFLAFGLLVYVIPQVVQRIDEVEEVYIQTMKTIGASAWQIIRWVYIPAVTSRVFADFIVLSAISWTYIIIAEVINTADGGIGALTYICSRQSRTDKVYAVLIVITLIGFAFDKGGKAIDRFCFRYKYAGEGEGNE